MNPPSAVAGSLATSAPEPSLALPGTRLVARSCEVPAASPELFLALGLAGDAGFWDARALGDPDALAQAGVVWSVPVTSDVSSEAFVEAGRLAAQTIDRLDVPALRAFAAVPFDGERGFLRIPRFAYAVSGDVGRLIVVGDPHVHDVESELAALRRSWEVASARSAPPAARSVADGLATELLDDGRSAYARLVAAALGAIAEGTFEKIVTARKLELGLAHAPALDALVSALPRSRVARFLVAQGAETFFGATPETLVRLADGTARADALAGSRPAPRGAAADDPLVASALAEELLRSDKDRREHELVVAFVRRALLGLGELGEVAAPTLVRLPNVWHLHTPLRAQVRGGVSVTDLVAALHPTPAVLGVPSALTRTWLRAHETFSRGLYAGSIGTVDARGEGTFVVGIRSGRLWTDAETQRTRASLYAGGGIVAGSDVDKEIEETDAKLSPLRHVLGCPGASS